MRAVVQRVDSAAVEVEGAMVGSVGKGLLVLLGVEKEDTDRDLEYLLDKVAGLRIFEDEQEKMNLSVAEIMILTLYRESVAISQATSIKRFCSSGLLLITLGQSLRCTEIPLPRVIYPITGSPGIGLQQRASLTIMPSSPLTKMP